MSHLLASFGGFINFEAGKPHALLLQLLLVLALSKALRLELAHDPWPHGGGVALEAALVGIKLFAEPN